MGHAPRLMGLSVFLINAIFFWSINPAANAQDSEDDQPKQDAPEAITPEDVFVFEPYSRPFLAIEGEQAGDWIAVTLARHEDANGVWVLTIDGVSRFYLANAADGDVVITRMDQIDSDKAVVYSPPLVLLPSRLEAGTSFRQSGKADVYSLESGEQTETGTYSHELTHVSRTTLKIPAGRLSGYLLDYHHRVEVPLAVLDLSCDIAFVPNVGLAYIRQKTTLEKMGMFGDTTVRGFALGKLPGDE